LAFTQGDEVQVCGTSCAQGDGLQSGFQDRRRLKVGMIEALVIFLSGSGHSPLMKISACSPDQIDQVSALFDAETM
jgi:hypothetical protein